MSYLNPNFKILIVIFIVSLVIKKSESIDCSRTPKTDEAKLKKEILCDYDKTIKPGGHSGNKTVVDMKLIIKHFEFVDTEQTLKVHSWLPIAYSDSSLKWNPESYSNIQHLIVGSDLLWMPDIQLYNAHVGMGNDACSDTECFLNNTGVVKCVSPCTYNAMCESDFENWPYDRQTCLLTMGMWLTSGEQVDFNFKNISAISAHAIQHTEWKLVKATFKYKVAYYGKNNDSHPTLNFNFTIERHSGIHVAVIIAPAFVMIVINLLSVWLDLNSLDRIVLFAVNIFIHFQFIQQMSWYIPKNGETCPRVITFFRDSLIMTASLLIETIVIRTISRYRDSIPLWVDTVNNLLVNNPIGAFFRLDKASPKDIESNDSDEQALVKSTENLNENMKWKQFAKIVDRVLFVLFIIVYIILMMALIPVKYSGDLDGDVKIEE